MDVVVLILLPDIGDDIDLSVLGGDTTADLVWSVDQYD
jgi:hypothetical protein